MRQGRLVGIVVLFGWVAIATACSTGGFSYDDLSTEPVAVAVRTEDGAKQLEETVRREMERLAEDAPKLPADGPFEQTVRIFEQLQRGERNRVRFTRLEFLDAVERETERVDFATRDTRPLAWNLDRSRLLFAAEKDKRTQLFEWLKTSGEVRQVTFGRPHVGGSYGPGDRIVAVRESRVRERGDEIVGGYQLVLTDPGGGRPKVITDGPMDVEPAWSPDGKTLIYLAWDRNGIDMLRRLDLSGDEPVGRSVGRGRGPVFSPDGNWVVYSARTRAGFKLWKMHPDGSGRRALGRSGLQEYDPSISPDGKWVVYVGHNPASESGPQLLVKSIDGSNARQLSIEGSGLVPKW